MNEYTDVVERGAKFLDARDPGWRDRINLARFDMSTAYGCVLGQLYGNGSWRLAKERYQFTDEDAVKYGFTLRGYYPESDEWSKLTKAWLPILSAPAHVSKSQLYDLVLPHGELRGLTLDEALTCLANLTDIKLTPAV